MRILFAIVHHWNPAGDGNHGSLRSDSTPRVQAFEQQLLSLQRLGNRHLQLNIAQREAQPANQDLQNHIQIAVISDGQHHLIDRLDPRYQGLYSLVLTKPLSAKHLGFEAQRFLASQLEEDFDLYCYLEDDLIIHDPWFFKKIAWFISQAGDNCVLLPHRIELASYPHPVDRFYIDGTIPEDELLKIIPENLDDLAFDYLQEKIIFKPPANPHSGCFFLSKSQLLYWTKQSHWLDIDCSYISPLESAATLGLAKSFNLYKPSMKQASWLEVQHWGNSFHCLLGRNINLPGYESVPIEVIEKASKNSKINKE